MKELFWAALVGAFFSASYRYFGWFTRDEASGLAIAVYLLWLQLGLAREIDALRARLNAFEISSSWRRVPDDAEY
jgi:hypothetical protein